MKFPLFIALRYLFAKKSHNAINVISLITVLAVIVGSMALIIILSIFNGFDILVKDLINSFDPDLKITPVEGKTFTIDQKIENVLATGAIASYAEIVEENAILRYDEKQDIATIKGVSQAYKDVTGVDSMLIYGSFTLSDGKFDFAVVGQGIAYKLDIPDKTQRQMVIYVPRKGQGISFDPTKAFKKQAVFISGKFAIEQTKDEKYVFVPIEIARELIGLEKNEVSSIEIKVSSLSQMQMMKETLKKELGTDYQVKDRYEQNEVFYRVMKIEKFAIIIILSLVLFIASFNILGSLTMLILDKKKDVSILNSLGASKSQLTAIFLLDGWFISILGGIVGLLLGAGFCWLQIEYGLIQLGGGDSFVINAYPVHMKFTDFVVVFLIVSLIGVVASWYPVKQVTNRFINNYT